jgi:antitoxin component of RelBE/YafQ-DinJ toxin-antitoxin module
MKGVIFMLEQKTISVRIDEDLYEYFKEEEIPISSIVQMLLKGFAKSDNKFDMLSKSIEDGEFIKISEIERKVKRIVETIELKLWDEKTIKFMTDMSKLMD